MNNIMLDIETTGNITSSAVIQISMVRFDESGNVGDHIHINIDAEEQYKLGAQYTQNTLDWWQKTNPALFESITTQNVKSVREAIDIINSFVTKSDYIWCHATFDFPIVDNLYHLAGETTRPWDYKRVHDLRTIVSISGINLHAYNWAEEKTHDSLDDCMFQIKYTTDAIKAIKFGNNKEKDLERTIKGLCEIENYITGLETPSKDVTEIGGKVFNLRVEEMKALDLVNQNNEYSYSNWIESD